MSVTCAVKCKWDAVKITETVVVKGTVGVRVEFMVLGESWYGIDSRMDRRIAMLVMLCARSSWRLMVCIVLRQLPRQGQIDKLHIS